MIRHSILFTNFHGIKNVFTIVCCAVTFFNTYLIIVCEFMSFHCSLFLIRSRETIWKKLFCLFFWYYFFLAFLSVHILSFSGKVVNRIKYDSNIMNDSRKIPCRFWFLSFALTHNSSCKKKNTEWCEVITIFIFLRVVPGEILKHLKMCSLNQIYAKGMS